MKAADHSILQVLNTETRLALRSGDVAYNTGISQPWTSERLGVLTEHGLVEKIEEEGSNPRYRITGLGQRYLAGDLSPKELEEND